MDSYICSDCPRSCNALRGETGRGFCRMGAEPVIARAALHFDEEPVISGTRGSGAVFFSGCALRCRFCQNFPISHEGFGQRVSVERLREIYAELIAQGAYNINLVNPTHFARAILESLDAPLPVPVVWNSGGYEKVETLQLFEGRVQVYLPDLKYLDRTIAKQYSAAADYPEIATAAIQEMVRQTGPFVLDSDGMLQKGVLIRHLILPEQGENSTRVIDWVSKTFQPDEVLFSLMSQYTPMGNLDRFPALRRPVSPALDAELYEYLMQSRIENGFYQDLESSTGDMIPKFDQTGV